MNKKLTFELGTEKDIDDLEKFYDDINDYLMKGINYPGWRKGVYPAREHAENGVKEQKLYIARDGGKIAGSFILRHEPEPAYSQVKWNFTGDYSDILVIYTLAVHPDYLKQGVGTKIMNYITELARESGIKSLRLDVYDKNLPAIRLYEKCGFEYIATVDLGYRQYGLDWFLLYELLLG